MPYFYCFYFVKSMVAVEWNLVQHFFKDDGSGYLHLWLEIFFGCYILAHVFFLNNNAGFSNKEVLKIFINFICFTFVSYIYYSFFAWDSFPFILGGASFLINKYVVISKLLILGMVFCFLVASKGYFYRELSPAVGRQFPALLAFLLFFLFGLTSTNDFILMYLFMEGLSLVLYTFGSFLSRNLVSLEATIKYFFLNSIVSTFMIYGISCVYGCFGSSDFFEVEYLSGYMLGDLVSKGVHLPLFLSLFGILFKLGVVPFYTWVPDVYDGLWFPVMVLFSSVTKLAFCLFFLRLYLSVFSQFAYVYQHYLVVIGVGSIVIGSLGSFAQLRIKRLFAYASISHAGHIVLSASCGTVHGLAGGCIYTVVYTLSSLTFLMVLLNILGIRTLKNLEYIGQLNDFMLINKEVGSYAIFLLLVMSGIPPFSGFFAKGYIYWVLVDSNLESVAIIAMLFGTVSAYYYLNIIQCIAFTKRQKCHDLYLFVADRSSWFAVRVLVLVNFFAVALVFGGYPYVCDICLACLRFF